MSDMIGSTISHYRILEHIGSGGMGVVYKAEDTKLGRQVALKFLSEKMCADRKALERFQREARMASALNHPNICTVYEIDEHEGRPFIAMELLEGDSLSDRIAKAPLVSDEIIKWAVQILDALEAAHAKGIIHRDIKPQNIFITHDGRAKLADFGIAKLAPSVSTELMRNEASTATGLIGTLPYMSPEQMRCERLDNRTDLFSLGSAMYEMITGRLAFSGPSRADIIDSILSRTPVPPSQLNPGTPERLDEVIAKALQKDRDSRYQSAAEFRSDLLDLSTVADKAAETGPSTLALLSVFGVFLAAIAAVLTMVYLRQPPPLNQYDPIVIADFVNNAGDPVFDETLKEALLVQLEQSPYLAAFSDERMRNALRFMQRAEDTPVTPDIAREICRRENAKAMLEGSIAALGSQYVLTLNVTNCNTGDSLAREQRAAGTKEDVLSALGSATSALRRRLGESLRSIRQFDIPIQQATTSSLEALRLYSLGDAMRDKGERRQSIAFYRQAIELDPDFAIAHARLAVGYGNLGELNNQRIHAQTAFDLRDRVSERERFYISAHYYSRVTGDLNKAVEVYRLWNGVYPQDAIPNINLCNIYNLFGQYASAVEVGRRALEQEPWSQFPYENLAQSYMGLNQFDQAKGILEKSLSLGFEGWLLHAYLYEIAFLEDDSVAMERHLAWARSKPDEYSMLSEEGDVAAFQGRLAASRELYERGYQTALRLQLTDSAAGALGWKAMIEALLGDVTTARRDVTRSRAIARTVDVLVRTALASAFIGDIARAESLANELAEGQERTLTGSIHLPTVRAAIELARGNPDRAIELLKSTMPYELGLTATFKPIYVRGLAYLEAGDGANAAAEFQKIIKNRGIAPASPFYPLSQLGLARALDQQGDRASAARVYQELRNLWNSADPDLPVRRSIDAFRD
jgi:tetratricopeptide (TPR) repeat protein/predicted Ser/Thr protein kinase